MEGGIKVEIMPIINMPNITTGSWRVVEENGESNGYYIRKWREVSVETIDGPIRIGYGVEKRRWDEPEKICDPFPEEKFARAEANAKLIACAPELLFELKNCAELLRAMEDDGDLTEPSPMRLRIEALIARAEGAAGFDSQDSFQRTASHD